MNKIVYLALLVAGTVLVILGIQATNSFSSDVSRFFTGSPTDKAVWMLIGGAVAAVAGLVGLMMTWRRGQMP
jgi:divalent metal cation (Fe/Co/Zn/Cd) transporter